MNKWTRRWNAQEKKNICPGNKNSNRKPIENNDNNIIPIMQLLLNVIVILFIINVEITILKYLSYNFF